MWESDQTPKHYRALFEGHPQPMWVYDTTSLAFLAVNEAALARYGYSRDEFLAMTLRDIRPEADVPALEENLGRERTRLQQSGDWRHRLKDGRIILVEVRSSSIEFEGRQARLVIADDVTEQRALARKIQESEERFRAVAHVTADVIWDWSLKENQTWYSDGLLRIFGHSPEIGRTDPDFWVNHIHPEDRERVVQSTHDAIGHKRPRWGDQYRFVRQDGSVAHVQDNAYLLYDADGELLRLVGGISDISDRKAAEVRLAQQAALLDLARDAIIVHDMQQRVEFWNEGAERTYGWSKSEAIGKSLTELLCGDGETLAAPVAATRDAGEWTGEISLRRKDGRRITVEGSWTLVRNESGEPTSILAIETDVTKRIALEEQLRQSQRMEAVGQLTGGIAHDFNNLLTVILGNSELLVEQLPEGHRLRPLAEMSLSAATRGAELTQRLLAFARRQPLDPKAVDIGAMLTGMDSLLRRTIAADIVLEIIPDERAGGALVDPSQLEAAVLNLCLNARDAMPDGGRLTVEARSVVLDEQYSEGHLEAAAGEYVMIAVSDNGTGIAPELLSQVFEPFFTTKEVGKGTGLGLSMVYGFARQSGGHVSIYSELGQGTSVKIYLPKAQSSELVSMNDPALQIAAGGGETVLLVEDDPLVRVHVQGQLESLGYQVVSAAGAVEALAIIAADHEIDLLFTDVMMPGTMNGAQLARAVQQLRPDMPVLFTSGYAENAITHQGYLLAGVTLLSKPYSRVELAQKLSGALFDRASLLLDLL